MSTIDECGVSFKLWFEKEDGDKDKQLKWTSLMGPDKLKLLKRLPEKK